MLNPEEIISVSTSKFQSQAAINIYKQVITNLQTTLNKSFENRHHNDHTYIQNFIQLSPFFKQFILHFSLDFAKNIVKKGKIYTVNGKRCIYEMGDQIVRVFMPLKGKFYKKQQAIEDKQNISVFAKLQELIKSIHSFVPIRKKNSSLQRRMTMLIESSQLKTTHANFKQITNLKPFTDQQPLFINGIDEEIYKQSLYSNGQSWLFAITVESLRQCLFQQYEYRLIQKTNLFRKMECFNILDNSQLKIFVQKIPYLQLKKDQFVFREGDPSQNLYLLVEGQAKAQKTVQLFKEDPNLLYRGGVVRSQAGRRMQKPPQFSYADFEGVYNYSPQKKRMDLGLLTPITIFGEEQIAAGLPREADVQIISTKAKLFSFTLKDIEAATGNGKKISVDLFMDELYHSITSKRIIVRREGLSNNLELENRRNMNYFFIQSSQLKVGKTRSKTAKQRINRSLSPAVPSNIFKPHSPVKPRYHNFNFNQFVSPSKKQCILKFSQDQQKIANLAHNSGEIQGKIQVSSKLFKERQSHKHKINIATPLFDGNYYKKQRKQILRIQNKKRMRLIQVTGISSKSRLKNNSSSVM